MRNRWPIVVSILLALALAVASLPALALGLGQIKVLSPTGQPLVAEIPIISSDPAELRQLQARLASPETFRRIGLEPPQGAVANLRFAVALDAEGNPVVRVTSPVAIDQPLLTFLVEVDWGQGRLVREYSVLVDAPESAVAVAQPPIQAPQPPPSSTVVRPDDTVQPVAAAPDVRTEALPPEPVPTPEPATPEPAPVATQPAPPPAPVAPPPPAATPGEYGPVQRGQTLSEIASGLGTGDYSLNQTMLALLRTNPEAFIDGNINLLREGAVLRMPERDVLAELSPSEANAVVRAQVRSWRDRNAPPVVAADAVAGPAGDAAAADRADAGNGPRSRDNASVADARLEIVPPAGEGGQAPGSRSGLSAGGEGDMLRNELRQAKEDLAARDAEVEELRARMAELEDLQQKQAKLLDLKDSELASVQQRLAESRAAGGDAATAETTEAAVAAPGNDAAPSPLPWLVGGLVLLLVAAGAWWWQRGRRPAAPAPAPAPRRNYDTAAMAAGLTGTASSEPGTKAPAGKPSTAAAGKVPSAQATAAPAARAPAAPAPASAPAPTTTPAARPPAPAAAPEAPAAPLPPAQVEVPPPPPATEAAPTWHAGAVPVVADSSAAPGVPLEAKGQASPAGRDGLELARAYLDLGDHQAARTLLREVLLGRDPGAREEAARMLRELG